MKCDVFNIIINKNAAYKISYTTWYCVIRKRKKHINTEKQLQLPLQVKTWVTFKNRFWYPWKVLEQIPRGFSIAPGWAPLTVTWFNLPLYHETITTRSLVNIHHHTQLATFFFLWWGLLRSIVSNFQICNTILVTIITMLYITFPGLIFLITGSLYLWPFTHFSHP